MQLKNNKAGYDRVLNEHISSTVSILLSLYTKLFNLILDTRVIPDEWLTGIVKPIFKNKGDPTQPENYRTTGVKQVLEKGALPLTIS